MSKQITAVYPISANPPTWGHANILYRASSYFEHIYWAAAVNPKKQYLFSPEERMQMMQEYVNHYQLDNVSIGSYSGSTVRYAEKINAQLIIKGLRSTADFQGEFEQATGNLGMNPNIETFFMFSHPDLSAISSSLVREIALLGESIEPYVLKSIAEMVHQIIEKHQNH